MGFKDFYGADREGQYALLAPRWWALDANTGKRLWHHQFVEHDVWGSRSTDATDASSPFAVTVGDIPAVAQIMKYGFVWVFDRVTGEKPISGAGGFRFSKHHSGRKSSRHARSCLRRLKPFARQRLTEETLTQRHARRQPRRWRAHLGTLSNRGRFDPPSLEGHRHLSGTGWWRRIWRRCLGPRDRAFSISTPTNKPTSCSCGRRSRRPAARPLLPRSTTPPAPVATAVDRKGNPPSFPALLGLTKRMASQQIAQMIAHGSGRMPGFEGSLSKTQIDKPDDLHQ